MTHNIAYLNEQSVILNETVGSRGRTTDEEMVLRGG